MYVGYEEAGLGLFLLVFGVLLESVVVLKKIDQRGQQHTVRVRGGNRIEVSMYAGFVIS